MLIETLENFTFNDDSISASAVNVTKMRKLLPLVYNVKKKHYNRGKPQVKYIDIGNHYSQYKNFKNNIYNLRAKNNYQVIDCGKGPNIIIPNKMIFFNMAFEINIFSQSFISI